MDVFYLHTSIPGSSHAVFWLACFDCLDENWVASDMDTDYFMACDGFADSHKRLSFAGILLLWSEWSCVCHHSMCIYSCVCCIRTLPHFTSHSLAKIYANKDHYHYTKLSSQLSGASSTEDLIILLMKDFNFHDYFYPSFFLVFKDINAGWLLKITVWCSGM